MKTSQKLAVLALALCVPATAQVNSTELSAMKMWPAPNSGAVWLASKHFTRVGESGYYLDNTPMWPDAGAANEWWKWRFVYYTGLAGKKIVAYGTWGHPVIPPPVVRSDGRIGDNCAHAHVSYGVWLEYAYYSGGQYYSGYTGPWGGSKSGIRVNNNYCKHSVNNPLARIDPRFGWGRDYIEIRVDPVGSPFVGMVVGASAVSHGGFGCSTHGCVNQPYIIAYTLPY